MGRVVGREHGRGELRVAIAGDDAALVAELEAALAAAGLAASDPDRADVVVVDEARALTDRSPDARRVIASPAPRAGVPGTPWWQPWYNRAACEAVANARILGAGRLAEAIAWVASEDHAERTAGPPRLTCVGSTGHVLGAAWPIPATGTIWLGRGRNPGPDDIHVPSSMVARRHAQLGRDTHGLWLRDLRSTNGSLLVQRGRKARLLCPTTYGRDLPAPPWLHRDPTEEPVHLATEDELVVPGWARFRLDGTPPENTNPKQC